MSQYFSLISKEPVVNLPLNAYSPTDAYFKSAPNGGTSNITSSTNFDSTKGCQFNNNTSISFNGFDTSTTISFNLFTLSTGTSSNSIYTTLLSVGDISILGNTSNSLVLQVMNQRNAYFSSNTISIDDGWHYITLKIDVVSGISTVTLYVDAFNKYVPSIMTSFPTLQTSIKPIKLGNSQYSAYVLDLSIFNTSLTDIEIQKLFCFFRKNATPNILPVITTTQTYDSVTITATTSPNVKELIITCDKVVGGVKIGDKLNNNNTTYTSAKLTEGIIYEFNVSVIFICDPVPKVCCSNPKIVCSSSKCPIIDKSKSSNDQLVLDIIGNQFVELIIKCDTIIDNNPINTKLNTNNSDYTSPVLPIGIYNFGIYIRNQNNDLIFCRNIYLNVGKIVPKNPILESNLPLLAIILGTMYGIMIISSARYLLTGNNSR
jgi:hypothetical protein